MPDPDYLARLARHLCRTDLADLPGPVVDRARWLLADTVGCIAGGSTAPELQHLREALAHDLNGGPVRVIGTDVRAGPTMAALLNGTAATVLEMAEGHNRGGGQNAAQLVPAALAAAESVGASGADLLRAVALGYEVGVRFGRATTFRPAIHPNGTVGAVAAAVAAACIAGADEERMALTIRLVSPLIVANSWQIAREGGEARNIATGHASAAGVLADRMAAAGLTAESDAPGTVFGAAIGDAFDGAGVVADWGDPWFVPGGYFKRYACGRYIHAPLDALELMVAEAPVDADAVEAIDIDGISVLAKLDNPAPTTSAEARFSTPYAVSAFLHLGGAGPDAFAEEHVADRRIADLALRVTVKEDPALTARMPEFRPCRVKVRFRDGSVRESAVERIRGDAKAPHGEEVMRGKFLALAGAAWDDGQARAVLDTLLSVESVDDVRDIPLATRL